MLLRPFLNDDTSCASYLFGCTTHRKLAVVDPHADLVDRYLATADAIGSPIVAVFETHLQADHLSGLPELVERTSQLPGVSAAAPRLAAAANAMRVLRTMRSLQGWFRDARDRYRVHPRACL